MINEDQKEKYHLSIGRLLLSNIANENLEEEIFEIVNHLNSGIRLIVDESEKNNLSRLNFLAGKKAKSATAYDTALAYFFTGLELLGENSWETQYCSAMSLYSEIAEVYFLTGDFENMDNVVRTGLDHKRTLLDTIKLYEIVIQSLIARARLKESVSTAIEILKQLGVNVSKNPTRAHVLFNLLRVQAMLYRRDTEALINLPEMSDPYTLAAMRILMSAASSAYRGNILMVTNMLLKMVQLSIRFGNSPFSPYGYSMYAIFLLGIIGNIDKAYQFGKFPIELINRGIGKEYTAKINILFNLFIKHWKDPVRETVEPLYEGYQISLETGDLEFAAYSLMYSGVHSLFSGKNLESVNKELGEYIKVIKNLKQERTLKNAEFHRQFTLNLMGHAKDRTLLVGESFNEEETVPFLKSANDNPSLGSYYTNKTIICYMFGKEKESLHFALESEKFKLALVGLIYLPLVNFYTSLVFLSQIQNSSRLKRLQYHLKIYRNQKVMKKWARHCQVNHLHKWYLVEAERFRVLKKDITAVKYYDIAIDMAHRHNFIIEEALANELAAKYFWKIGNLKIARIYMTEACRLYKKWGATAKVDHLCENYSEMIEVEPEETGKDNGKNAETEKTRMISSGILDMKAIQQASQAISSEIHLGRLLEKLMNIVISNAGAQKGLLLLLDEEEMYLEGEALAEKKEFTVLQHIPLIKVEDISQSIVSYVCRTNETVVINDAGNEERFVDDDHLLIHRPKSIFCMPLINQNKLSGILYLENNLATGAFTPERVEILEMLTGEIVISIENAKLYKILEESNQSLEMKVAERTKEIETQTREIKNNILYASKIQRALMPPQEDVEKLLPSFFILNRPRDVVSGDYYWVAQKDGKVIIALADCTGHGVSGAFMSILGLALLNEIVNKTAIIRTNEVLNQLRGLIIKLLHQTGKPNEARDGMEMALCMIDFDKMKLQYSGAFRPLYIIKNKKLIEIKGDFMPLGISHDDDSSFTNNEILIEKNDIIYIFSDGYVDQIGGPERKTLKSKNFKSLLMNIHQKPPEEQKKVLENYFEEWRGNLEQIDDILIVGIRIQDKN
jgi:serine phosphatase RsbU (regulator of sigma subunit)